MKLALAIFALNVMTGCAAHPAAALAKPLCDPGQWKDWAAQQDSVERTWRDNAKIVAVPQGVDER